MDKRLHSKLELLHAQIGTLADAERLSLSLEAEEDTLWSKLYLESEGKNVAEKEARAFTHPDWIRFQKGLVEAKVNYQREKRMLELRQNAWLAEYLEAKHEAEAIQKYPKALP